MNMDLRKKAENLAARPYINQVVLDETTTGQPIYVALSPELEGCIAQGETPDEALSNLVSARIDFIQSLLEDSLAIPEPKSTPTITTSSVTANFAYFSSPDALAHGLAPVADNSNVSSLTRLVGASFAA
jgi:predicted RNase H-like HicB family nuclease